MNEMKCLRMISNLNICCANISKSLNLTMQILSPESYIFKILNIGLISSQNIHILPAVLNIRTGYTLGDQIKKNLLIISR